ncbi:uncharacterized protein LOC108098903 isoform X3 [Drosophila ficusphila]|uniref:uncharacterized protein LOC108098903 isoform X3 n=1 Tax=Drosophila ficusphila TaxID=30025 RepID=UPI0007E6A150|nr:uncharacterized protein LOC108098903 isoform X3 [Drosophila ficusphila]
MLDLPEFNFIPPRNDIVNDFLKMPTNLSNSPTHPETTTEIQTQLAVGKIGVVRK